MVISPEQRDVCLVPMYLSSSSCASLAGEAAGDGAPQSPAKDSKRRRKISRQEAANPDDALAQQLKEPIVSPVDLLVKSGRNTLTCFTAMRRSLPEADIFGKRNCAVWVLTPQSTKAKSRE